MIFLLLLVRAEGGKRREGQRDGHSYKHGGGRASRRTWTDLYVCSDREQPDLDRSALLTAHKYNKSKLK